jgi:polar amino acid transport system substrate-binding protein
MSETKGSLGASAARRFVRCALALALFWVGSGAAWAACGELRVSLLPYPGVYERGADGSDHGFDADVARELSARTGCVFKIEPTNPVRMWPALKAGMVDITAGASYAPERAAEADFIVLTRLRSMVLMPTAMAERLPTRAAFNAEPTARLGVLGRARRADAAQAWVDTLRSQGRVSESLDMTGLLRAYEAGRVSAVLILPGSLHGRSEAWLAQQRLMDWLPQEPFMAGWAVSRAQVPQATRQLLKDAAEAARLDGTWRRLALKNLGGAIGNHYEVVPVPAAPTASAPTAPASSPAAAR